MFVATTDPGRGAKLRRSGMNRTLASRDFRQCAARFKRMPLLRSLADSVARVAINMALLTELESRLSKLCDYKPAAPMAAIPSAQSLFENSITAFRDVRA
jgi:hypothetical protein